VNFVVARSPDPDSRLPYLVRLPIDGGLILKVRDTWPADEPRLLRPSPGRLATGGVVDSREHYPYRFSKQQATTVRAALPAGDDPFPSGRTIAKGRLRPAHSVVGPWRQREVHETDSRGEC
jgi:hypothetical protein